MKALHVIPVRITDVKQFIKHYNLDERQRRGLYGFLASLAGYGGATAVARDLEVSPITVKAGADELKALCLFANPIRRTVNRVRQPPRNRFADPEADAKN